MAANPGRQTFGLPFFHTRELQRSHAEQGARIDVPNWSNRATCGFTIIDTDDGSLGGPSDVSCAARRRGGLSCAQPACSEALR